MIEKVLWLSILMIGAAFMLNLVRLVRGPAIVDRVLAADTMYINGLALLILFGMLLGSRLFFEIAMLIALFGFLSTVAFSKYILRGDVIERGD